MRTLLTLTAALILGVLAKAQAVDPLPAPAAALAPKSECPLCKVPNRAALLAGTAHKCPADCTKLCCTGTEVTYLVEGLVCDDCSSKVTAALGRLEGVYVEAVCPNTGQARVRYDPAKVSPKTLIATIVAAGHPVTGERLSLEVPGMTDENRAAGVETALGAMKGVLKIVTTVGARPVVNVVFDPSLTTRDEIVATIDRVKAKVAG